MNRRLWLAWLIACLLILSPTPALLEPGLGWSLAPTVASAAVLADDDGDDDGDEDGDEDEDGAAADDNECEDDDDHAGNDDDDDDDDCLFVPNQVVVKVDLQHGGTVEAINLAYGTTTLETILGSRGIYLLQTPANSDVLTTLARMRTDRRLRYAEPNFYGQAPEGGGRGKWAWAGLDPTPTGTQAATALVGLAEAHTLSRGAGVIVAVLDTGIQLDHPQLANRLTPTGYDFVDDDSVPDEAFATLDRNGDGLVDESAGHGTHVAGIVGLAAPEAQIMPLRVLDASGRGNVFLIAEAVLYAAEQGADVVNLSLGTTRPSTLLAEVISEVTTQRGLIVVAAAGNFSSDEPTYPAAERNVIAVTAVDVNKQRAPFASYGRWVDLAAPGVEIYNAFPIDSYAYWSGTSMAAPLVAGQTALLLSLDSPPDPAEVEHLLTTTAERLARGLGAGLVNFPASLRAAGAQPPVVAIDPQAGVAPAALTVQAYLPWVTQ
jgi:thermitase